MSATEYQDFVFEMRAAVYEELALFEVAHGAIDRLPGGDVRHGPWLPEDCAGVLSRWHRAGLLGLYRYTSTRGNGPNLTKTDAIELVAHPERWVQSEDWTEVAALVLTDLGQAAPVSKWESHVARAG